MRIAVVTPYYAESTFQLARCMDSVKGQSHAATHFMVSDGKPSPWVSNSGVDHHIQLSRPHGDYGDTPRLIGTMSAFAQGYDGVCWLDADNWFEPNHIEIMTTLANRHVASVVTATRNLCRPDGSFMDVCTESDGMNFNDTNCYLIMREAMSVANAWGFKSPADAVIGDRHVWKHIREMVPNRVHSSIPTVNYVTKIAGHYLERNEEPPIDARVIIKPTGETIFRSVLYADVRTQ